jgi:quercetin dioxygenase-like cupin family protein
MAVTHIDTNSIPRTRDGAQGEVAEILNNALCGAENVVGQLRWLAQGERFEPQPLANAHQLIYLMEGAAVIELNDKPYDASRGAGVYLGPNERAAIAHAGDASTKLFHLIVPIRDDR